MPTPVKILGFAGACAAPRTTAPPCGRPALVPADATLETIELDGIPGFNQDDEKTPPPRSSS